MIRIVIIKILFDWICHYLSGIYPWILKSVNWTVAYEFIDFMFISAILLHIFFIIDDQKLAPKWTIKWRTTLKFFFFMASMSYWLLAWVQLWFINASVEMFHAGLWSIGVTWIHVASAACGIMTFGFTYKFKRKYSKYRYI